jgi:hypothetical protein
MKVKVPAPQSDLPCERPVTNLLGDILNYSGNPQKAETFTTTIFSINLINKNVRLKLQKLNTQLYNPV